MAGIKFSSRADKSERNRPKRARSRQQDREESTEQAIARYNWWLTLFTAVLAVATLGLGVATVGLYYVSLRQLRHAETEAASTEFGRKVQYDQISEQIEILRQSAEAAGRAAWASSDQARASTEQAEIARTALTQLERPYLFIFNVSGLEAEEYADETGPTGDVLLSVTYSVANYGKLPAIIKHAQAILSAGIEPPPPDRLYDGHELVAAPIFAAGERRDEIAQYHRWTGESGNNEDGETIPTLKNGESLFLWVILTYRGPFTDQHETRALWIYNESTGRFIPDGGPEHTGQK